ncbi:MAG: ABC transporter permease [Acidimicrobiales bacterium]
MKRPVLVKREKPLPGGQAIAFLVGVVVALAAGALLLWLSGSDPVEVYERMWESSLGSRSGIEATLVRAVPLTLAGLAVAVAGSMGLWNIGAEGQIMAGAIGAAWVARIGETWTGPVLITVMIIGGMVGGLLWMLGPALARAHLGVNEIITTLMLNEVAIRLAIYLIQGPWKDPESLGFPVATPLPDQAQLPFLFGDVHIGVIIAVALVAIVALLINRTPWGYELRVAGSSQAAARYAGISLKRKVLVVLLLSGTIAGIAGAVELSASSRLTENLSNGYGFAGIIVAALALMRPWAIVPVAIVFGAVQVGGNAIRTLDVSSAVSNVLQAMILFGALVVAVFMMYRVRWVAREAEVTEAVT